MLGISFAAISLIGVVIILINWSDLYHLSINGSRLNFVLPFMAVAWIGELICGILILKRRKILGRVFNRDWNSCFLFYAVNSSAELIFAVSDSAAFQIRLGCTFRDENLLRLALDASVRRARKRRGDRAQSAAGISRRRGAATHPDAEALRTISGSDEGPLTKARAKLVNRRALAERARALGLGAHLILGHGEETHGGRERPSALADAFEALLGAIFYGRRF